jgi:hypothetical protein
MWQGKKLFVDTAECSECGSTAVTYDITVDGDFLVAAAKLAGQNQTEFKKSFEEMYKKLKKHWMNRHLLYQF